MSIEPKELVIESNLDNLNLVENFIDELSSELHIKEDVYGNIIIAVTEAVNNGMSHGNKMDPSKHVKIKSKLLNPYLLSISVEDEGKGFDPTKVKDPTAQENLFNENGRGVFVMTHLAEEIKFLGKGNIIEMTFNV
jgi:serine/threonine-protein kinase RsbW